MTRIRVARLREPAEGHRLAGDSLGAADQRCEPWASGAAIAPRHHLRVEDGQQPLEVAAARGRQEGIRHGPLLVQVAIRHRRTLDPAASPAGQLARRGRRAIQDGRDLVERHCKDVVEHERNPLRGSQGVQHHEERQPHRIAQQGLGLGTHPIRGGHDGVRHMDLQGRFTTCLPRPQHVQADVRHDRGQPRAQVVDVG